MSVAFHKKMKQKGSIALVLVLISIALITAIMLEIMSRSQVSATIVVNRRDSAKAYELARAAFQWSLFRLQLDSSLDQIPVIPNTNYGGKKDDLSEVQWAIPLTYPLPFATLAKSIEGEEGKTVKIQAPKEGIDIGGSFISVIADESSKINLNDVGSGGPPGNVRWSGAAEILENLLISFRLKRFFKGKDHRELLWAIDDWTDSDSQVNHTGGGIEDAEYRVEDTPNSYHVKNGPFYTLQEIHMLKPMADEMFEELRPFVTVYPFDARIPRVSTTPVVPLGKVNINTAPMELIAALFSREAISNLRERLDCAQKFVRTRQGIVFRSIKGTEPSFKSFLQKACGAPATPEEGPAILTPSVEGILEVRSDLFLVEATGSSGVIEKTIQAVVWRKDPTKVKTLFWKVT